MAKEDRKGDVRKDERNESFENSKNLVKKTAAVPKEELDKKR